MSCIITASGKYIDPIEPKDDAIDIIDIAHALSMICRANGHTRIFYSVAQHSIACALEAAERGLSKEIIMGCLLHDASEAYLSDVTRPIKKELHYYLEVEERLQNVIWEHFIGRPLTKEEERCIFEIDDQMLSLEFKQLMPASINDEDEKLVRDVQCEFVLPEKVKESFIEIYERYSGD